MSYCILKILYPGTKVPIIISFLQVFDLIQNILTGRHCSLAISFLTFSAFVQKHTHIWLGFFCLLPLLGNTASPLTLASAFSTHGPVDRWRKGDRKSPHVCLCLWGFSACFAGVDTQMNSAVRLGSVCALLWIYVLGVGDSNEFCFTWQPKSVLESALVNIFCDGF